VPDRFGEPSGDIDLRDLGAALFAKALLVALVALAVERVSEGVHRGLEHRPAQVLRSVLCERAAAVFLAGLVHPRAEAGVAAQLLRRREPVDIADLRGDREREDPTDSGDREQQRDIGMIGTRDAQLAVDLIDLTLEVLDQVKARVDGSSPGLWDL
jgi:hypothetical protein